MGPILIDFVAGPLIHVVRVCEVKGRPKWVFNYKNETIQLVGADYKLYIFLATRALKTRFWAPKSSL